MQVELGGSGPAVYGVGISRHIQCNILPLHLPATFE